MNILEREFIYSSIIKFITIKDFINLSITNKNLLNKLKKKYIWKQKLENILDKDSNVDNYYRQVKLNYNSKSRNICSICNDYIIKNFFITNHDCNYGFLKCLKCENKSNCTCKPVLSSYHSKCIESDNNCIICPLCGTKTVGYFISINV
jgi:hypothetical protein